MMLEKKKIQFKHGVTNSSPCNFKTERANIGLKEENGIFQTFSNNTKARKAI